MKPRASIIPIFIPHLGCPCRCVFCNQRFITNQSREPDAEAVAAAIVQGLERAGDGAELAFYGGSFTALEEGLRRSYLQAAQPFIQSGKLSAIRVSTRPDAIDGRILDELREHGVKTIELGAQSMDDRVLALSRRGHSAEDTRRASEMIRGRGFCLILQMMVGLPGEKPDTPMCSAEQIAALKPDGVRIYPTAVIENTELALLWRRGEYQPLTVDRAADICAELIVYFESHAIRVIRVGLNPTEELRGEVLAGAYHPAFGEICRSRIMLRQAEKKIAECGAAPGSCVRLGVGRGRISMMTGQHRENIDALKRRFGLREIKVRETGPEGAAHVGDTAKDVSAAAEEKVFVEILEIY